MNYKLVLILLALWLPGEIFAQVSNAQRIVRHINHTLADVTVDNVYQKDVVYEVGLIGRGKIYLDKSYTLSTGKRITEHSEMLLKHLNGFRQQVNNYGSKNLVLLGSESSVLIPNKEQTHVCNELPVSGIQGEAVKVKRLAYLFLMLQSELDQYMLAQAFPVTYN